ncbi:MULTISPECIES: YicC/YloC family endoribonuclease [Thermoactinomyces]|jgi:uncharacterized protein (TIGR00255 family)|uniref:YicC family protein n=1 Tax=Thermoactinomyces daqus TaxID=1329516 RepID=A0A7W2AHB1_9BACL|nr:MULTISPECIES: YicC/YloC family endoribonuclease [Thermoactinomyces]MBA4542491.1 YicC family protein [Thermoactinomyces daqus]MBH8598109.1 YicC family protein [Thermoactinomyces sp. CICC 10523]MBH8603140.1 YicC family protein [Thermoactinomyces sp. CICC 10522]MBH8607053.1 YicC family protein [Thermoactinomyces sp. CICC 10521]
MKGFKDMENRVTVLSMTGYGHGEAEENGIRFVTEIRSTNHRFLDIVIRIPQGWLCLEDLVRKQVQKVARRGRIDVFITIEGIRPPERNVQLDWNLLRGFLQAGKIAEQEWGIRAELTLADLLQKPELWLIDEVKWDVEKYRAAFLSSVDGALKELRQMREQEGNHLGQDLTGRLQTLSKIVEEIERETPIVAEHVKKRLKTRLEEMLGDLETDPDRLLTEVAIWVEKADITEELTRLKSHMSQFEKALSQSEPVGRRLDFLVQEMNREVNTIGSKANLPSISSRVVDCKSVLEKIREQVQNIE